jgi:hypothetical protein
VDVVHLIWIGILGVGCAEEKDEETPFVPIRRVVHEMFTGSTCGPCQPADENLEAVLSANPDTSIAIKYQLGGDRYVSRLATERRMYYLPDVSGYAIPFVHADGVNGFHPNDMDDGEAYAQDDFDVFAAVPSVLDIEVEHTVTEPDVEITVRLHATEMIKGDALVLHAVIIENQTTGNVGTNGQSEFHDVMQAMVPDGQGTPLEPMEAGESRAIALQYTFAGQYTDQASFDDPVDHGVEHTVEEFDDLEVVVFVQDAEDWTVYNARSTAAD